MRTVARLLHTSDEVSPRRVYIPIVLCLTLAACARRDVVEGVGGSAQRGQQLIYAYNCGSCHTIPGVAEARGTIGPPLAAFGKRNYVTGSLVNTPENLSRWIREPQKVEPGNAMPDLGVTEQEAADIAAYLYSLQ